MVYLGTCITYRLLRCKGSTKFTMQDMHTLKLKLPK